jgi:alpha-L-arabinofuranosidase
MNIRVLCLLGTVFPCVAVAQTANVTINAGTTVQTVDDRLFGANSTIWDSALGTSQTQSLLQAAGIRAIRLPGGSLSDEYHWRINKNRDNTWIWSSGFNVSSTLTSNLSAHAMITVNYGSGTPEEAAAWVAYANFATSGGTDVTFGPDNPAPGTATSPTVGSYDWQTARVWANLRAATPLATDDGMNFLRVGRAAPFGFKYWEVGNENYGSWEYDLQSPQWNALTYANRAAQYITKMRSVDPTIKIGVVVVKSGEYNGWTQTVLAQLHVNNVRPDFVIYHRYDGAPGQESDSTLLQSANSWSTDAANLRTLINAEYGASNGGNVEIIVTENNSVYSNPGKQSTSLVNGLFLADSLANVMKTEIKGFFWWDIRNGASNANNNAAALYGWRTYGDYGLFSSVPSPTFSGAPTTFNEAYPTYYAFKLLSYFARGGDSVVSATSSNPLLSVFAVRRADNSHALLVINKDPANAISGSFVLAGVTATNANIYSFGKSNDDAAKPNAAGCADITVETATLTAGAFTRNFPSYSMSVISLGGPNYPVPTSTPAIVTQPTASARTAGQSATFTGDASGCPLPTYRWQRAPANSTTFTNLDEGGSYSGTATATLTVSSTTTAMNGDQFRLVATTAAGSANSTAAALTVSAAPTPPAGGGSSSSGGGGGGGGRIGLELLAALALAGLAKSRRRKSANA